MNYIAQTLVKSWVMAEMEIRKLFHDPTDSSHARPADPLARIFGEALSKVRAIPTGNFTYLQFITPGFSRNRSSSSPSSTVSTSSGNAIWPLAEILVTPTPRLALVWARWVLLRCAVSVRRHHFYIRVHSSHPDHHYAASLFWVFVITLLGAGFFTGLSMVIASIVKTRERFMGIGQVITLPLFFASNAIYPISIMPGWLQFVATINPLSYMVDGLRAVLIKDHPRASTRYSRAFCDDTRHFSLSPICIRSRHVKILYLLRTQTILGIRTSIATSRQGTVRV